MKFYGRSVEIKTLRDIRARASRNAQFTIVTGRRRIGKTELIDQALNDGTQDYVYLLITKQLEKPLCAALQEEVGRALGNRVNMMGTAERLIDIVRTVFQASVDRPLTLVIDEFQEIDKIDSAFFSELQGLWDSYHKKAKINFVVLGSIYRLMTKILFNRHEPLYGRSTAHLHLEPFPVSVCKKILRDHNPGYSNDDLLTLWTMTGGVAKYVELFMDNDAWSRQGMIESVFAPTSILVDEGRNLLSEEFRSEGGTYFSILASIAGGKTRFSEIETVSGRDVGTYLANLEGHYRLVSRIVPVFETGKAKNAAYRIDDCFLRFWFRFVFKNQHLIELKRYDALKVLMERDLDSFSGQALEGYFEAKFIEKRMFTKIGNWWDRKGENEIDLVCENELEDALVFYEIKRDASRLDLKELEFKAHAFLTKNPQLKSRNISYRGLSMEDM